MNRSLNWGIIGAGIIAHKMAEAIEIDGDSRLVAVASKTAEKAKDFADQHGIVACADYQTLVTREDVDVVYIATTHNFHYENAELALHNGKHVLVEKPFTVNADQAHRLIELARKNNLFLMEAIWVRFLPSMIRLKQILQSGTIGEIKLFSLSFGGVAPQQYLPRLTDPELAGGVTLDMGIYPITFINYLLDDLPSEVHSFCRFAETGVDEIASYQFKYASGCLATVNTSFNLLTKQEAMIYGSKGFVEFPFFQQGQEFKVYVHNGTRDVEKVDTVTETNHLNGFIYQVAEVVQCIGGGHLESKTIPLEETLNTMRLMDKMRADWGFSYPFER